MHAFSGEVARHISEFSSDKQSVPTIYKMLEEICEVNELLLVKVKIYESGEALRANPLLYRKNGVNTKKLSSI